MPHVVLIPSATEQVTNSHICYFSSVNTSNLHELSLMCLPSATMIKVTFNNLSYVITYIHIKKYYLTQYVFLSILIGHQQHRTEIQIMTMWLYHLPHRC